MTTEPGNQGIGGAGLDRPSADRGKANRFLHAAATERGLSHEDLRACCGVASLTELSTDQLVNWAWRIKDGRPSAARPRSPRRPSGVIRLPTDNQRRKLAELLTQTGWPEAMQLNWLRDRHPEVASGRYDSTRASNAIAALIRVVRKIRQRGPEQNRDRERAATRPEPNRDRERAATRPEPNRDRERAATRPEPNRDRKRAATRQQCTEEAR